MDPDDSFSPPLHGLGRGKKLHNILNVFNDSEIVAEAEYLGRNEGDTGISGAISVHKVTDSVSEDELIAFLIANWWHIPLEDDYWEYIYVEAEASELTKALEEYDSDEEGEPEISVPAAYSCAWICQDNELVDGMSYFLELDEGGQSPEPFNTKFEAPRPLTHAILDTHLSKKLKERHDG